MPHPAKFSLVHTVFCHCDSYVMLKFVQMRYCCYWVFAKWMNYFSEECRYSNLEIYCKGYIQSNPVTLVTGMKLPLVGIGNVVGDDDVVRVITVSK